MAKRLESDPWLSGILDGVAGLIWFAFAAEFIIRFSIAGNRWGYLRAHIVDLAIVILPFFAFLRVLRLGKLLRLQQLTSTARLYRLRGVTLRAWRALLLFDAVSRVINGPPAKRLTRLRSQLQHMELEMEDLRTAIRKIEVEVSSKSLSEKGSDPLRQEQNPTENELPPKGQTPFQRDSYTTIDVESISPVEAAPSQLEDCV